MSKMPRGFLMGLTLFIVLAAGKSYGQPSYAPKNTEPNPYMPGVSWGRLSDSRKWGATGGVDIAPDGTIWAYDRCGGNQMGCADSKLTAIFHFDLQGNVIDQFGAGVFNFPHGIHADRDGNVWVTDHGMEPPNGKGQAVYKFSAEGTLLLTLGRPGVSGSGPDTFNLPSDVVTAPNGDIFVADGHVPGGNNRIVKFDRTGRFIKAWGEQGTGDLQLYGPHALAMDSLGRLFVGDRSNNRVQIFDQDGTLLASWKQFGRPSGIFIDRHDVLYVADSESRSDNQPGQYGYNPKVNRGIRFGSVKDGIVTGFIPDPLPGGTSSAAEGVAVDFTGNVYGAEVGPRDLKKYVKAAPSSTSIPAEGGDIVITAVMHASVQIEYAGKVIQVDPAMGDGSKLKPADLVLVTDLHDDHMNPTRIARVRKSGAPVVMPRAVQAEAGIRISEPRQILANGQRRTIAGIPVEAVASYNIVNQMDGVPFHTKGRANGYVITLGGKRLFFAGDTECVPEIRALKDIDVAFLPMNLPFTMPPAEAAECVKAFKPKLALPYHFQGQDPELFMAAVKDSGSEARMLNWYPVIDVPDLIAMERPGVLVQARTHRVHVNCSGRGSPTVLLEASSGLALDWLFVQPEVAKTTRVCSYDRPGFGWSEPVEGLSRISESIQDLHAAFAAAGEKPPFVFVGAGDGALAARAYALEFPSDIAGMVIVEGFHEDGLIVPIDGKPAPVWAATAEQLRDILKAFQPPPNAPPPPPPPPSTDAPFDRLPPDVLTTRVTFERRSQNTEFRATFEQRAAMFEDSRQVALKLHETSDNGFRPLGSRPLVVLAASSSVTPETQPVHAKLASLSNNALLRVVASQGPQIYLWSPVSVVEAIREVVSSAQRGAALPSR